MRTIRVCCIAISLALGGCAVAPTQLAIYGEHVSHTMQHFTDARTDYGYNTVNVGAEWRRADGTGPFLDIAEGYNVGPAWHYAGYETHGALIGPRETFTARAGWIFRLPH